MTVTQRRPAAQQQDDIQVNEPGVQFSCDACGVDLTHTIRIKCADSLCQESDEGSGVDICPKCFCEGKEFAHHKRGHPYRVIEFNSYPILHRDWGADEELLLVKGISAHGMGNWKKIAEHVGTRTKAEVEEHYKKIYIDSPNWPLPKNLDATFDVDPEEFGNKKRRRIEEMNAAPPPPAKVAPVSAPGVHEISTFLPGRLEFEHELDNEAEDLVKDLEFGYVTEYGGNGNPFEDFAGVRVTNTRPPSYPPFTVPGEVPNAPAPLISPEFVHEDSEDADVKARIKWEQDRANGVFKRKRSPSPPLRSPVAPMPTKAPALPVRPPPQIRGKGVFNAATNGYVDARPVSASLSSPPPPSSSNSQDGTNGNAEEDGEGEEESAYPPPHETVSSLQFKLSILEMYAHRVEKRKEGKKIMFERGLVEYKKLQQLEKKRPKEERDIIQRIKPFAKLTKSNEDWEDFANGVVYESLLRKKIQDLQTYRKLGLQTVGDIEKYDADVIRRTQQKAQGKEYYPSNALRRASSTGRGTSTEPGDRDGTPAAKEKEKKTWKAPPLNLASSPSLHLLTPPEQVLCSQLRILPKPYLVIKETLVREYARRGGKLRRREARELVKIDVNKTAKIWDFLVQTGCLKIGDMTSPADNGGAVQSSSSQASQPNSQTQTSNPSPSLNAAATSLTNKPAVPSGLSRQSSMNGELGEASSPQRTSSVPGNSTPNSFTAGSRMPSFPGSTGGLPVMPNIVQAGGLPAMTNNTTTPSSSLPVMSNLNTPQPSPTK